MTATIDTGLDLSWVTFMDEDPPESCTYRVDECSAQATHRGHFRTFQGRCRHPFKLYCTGHAEQIVSRDRPRGRHPFWCMACPGSMSFLIKMVPIR